MTRRSDATRERILAAARDVFAESGFEGGTIRAIAARAEANQSLVIRYFGSKEALFARAAELDLGLEALAGVSPGALGEALVEHFIRRWDLGGEGGELAALLRAAGTHAAARERMGEIFQRQLTPLVRAAAPDDAVDSRAALVASQMLGLAFVAFVLGASLPSPSALITVVGQTVQAYLTGPMPDRA